LEHTFGEFAIKASVKVITVFSVSVVNVTDFVQTVVEAQFTFENSQCIAIFETIA